MSNHTFNPRGVCSREINFEIEDGNVKNVVFTGGCDGNLKAIARLVDGRPAQEVISILEGNTCGMRNTSCADQFAQAIREALH